MTKHVAQQLIAQAGDAYGKGQHMAAEQLCRQALAADSDQADALNMLGILCAQRGAYEEAETDLTHAVRIAPDNPAFRNNLGEAQRLRGDLTHAIGNFQAALKLAPTYADAHYNLGLAFKAVGNPAGAIIHLDQAVRNNPEHQQAWLQLSNILLETWRLDEAAAGYLRLLDLAPAHVDAQHNLGIAYLRGGRYGDAATHLERAVALRPKMVSAHHLLGLAKQELGDVAAAQAAFEIELANDPDNLALELHVEALGVPIPAGNRAIDAYVSQLDTTLDAYIAEVKVHPKQVARLSWEQLINANAKPPFYLSYYGRELKPLLEKWAAVFAPKFAIQPPGGGQAALVHQDLAVPLPAVSAGDGEPLHIGYVVTHGHAGVFIKDRISLLNRMDVYHLL